MRQTNLTVKTQQINQKTPKIDSQTHQPTQKEKPCLVEKAALAT